MNVLPDAFNYLSSGFQVFFLFERPERVPMREGAAAILYFHASSRICLVRWVGRESYEGNT
jgi:hypothetical protein